jgi:hypothetical protein
MIMERVFKKLGLTPQRGKMAKKNISTHGAVATENGILQPNMSLIPLHPKFNTHQTTDGTYFIKMTIAVRQGQVNQQLTPAPTGIWAAAPYPGWRDDAFCLNDVKPIGCVWHFIQLGWSQCPDYRHGSGPDCIIVGAQCRQVNRWLSSVTMASVMPPPWSRLVIPSFSFQLPSSNTCLRSTTKRFTPFIGCVKLNV